MLSITSVRVGLKDLVIYLRRENASEQQNGRTYLFKKEVTAPFANFFCVGGIKIDVKPFQTATLPLLVWAELSTFRDPGRIGRQGWSGREGCGAHRFAKESSIAVFGVLAKF